jgi:hypothetical protein
VDRTRVFMEKAGDEIAAALERLSAGLKALEQRVSALEGTPARAPETNLGDFLTSPSEKILQVLDEPADAVAAAVERETYVPVIGKAVLGIAGAYLLRSIAESGTLPFSVAVTATILYAGCWLAAAVRARRPQRFSTLAYSITGMLIFIPMLWETTLRFHAVPAAVTAAVLAAFTLVGLFLSARQDRPAVAWIVSLPATILALGLMTTTHNLAPFIAALLLLAAAVEYADASALWPGLRWFAAVAADFAVLSLVYAVARPQGLPPDFVPLSGGVVWSLEIALLLIYGGSALFRATTREAAPFDLWQPLIAVWLLLGSTGAMVVVFSGAAIATAWLARSGRRGLRMHGAAYLIVAALLGGLLPFAVRSLAGAPEGAPGADVWIVAGVALVCYLLDQGWAAVAVTAVAAFSLAAFGVTSLAGGADASPSLLATSRTILICACAIALAHLGKRWARTEWLWIARIAVVVAVLKMLADDFRHANAAAVAVSLLCLGAALIVMPRWTRSEGWQG